MDALLAQALHLANYWIVRAGYDGQPRGTGVYWSLAVEEHFYLVFPCLYLLLRRLWPAPRAQATALYAMCAAVLAWRCLLVFGLGSATDRTYVASDTRVDSILFGCALALSGNPALDGRVAVLRGRLEARPPARRRAACCSRPSSCATPRFRETFRYSLQGIGLVPVFVVALRYPGWGPCRALNLRAMSFLGVLSYPLYLVHHVRARRARRRRPGSLRAALALALSIGVAWAIHELVEKPCARLRRRLSGRAKAPPMGLAPALAEARGP